MEEKLYGATLLLVEKDGNIAIPNLHHPHMVLRDALVVDAMDIEEDSIKLKVDVHANHGIDNLLTDIATHLQGNQEKG